jgi:hypothetical protein
MQRLIILLGLAALTGGCASVATLPSTFGSLSPSSASLEIYNPTEVKLTEGNFMVVKTDVAGQSREFGTSSKQSGQVSCLDEKTKPPDKQYSALEIKPHAEKRLSQAHGEQFAKQ